MTSRCRHEHAIQSRQLDSWLWCASCNTHIKKREAETFRFDADPRH